MNAGTIALPFLIILGCLCIFFYVKNLLRAASALRNKQYTVKLALRAVGIFMPVIGVFMGMVPA